MVIKITVTLELSQVEIEELQILCTLVRLPLTICKRDENKSIEENYDNTKFLQNLLFLK